MYPGARSLRRSSAGLAVALMLVFAPAVARAQTAAGIPVTDSLVQAKCASCHAADDRGNLQVISFARATPEGWQAALQRMVRERDVTMTPLEARAIVRYLSTRHGLAPEEAKPIMYYAERRVHDEAASLDAGLVAACTRCHEAAMALSWRRTADGWTQFAERHGAQYQFTPDAQAVADLARAAPFASPEWTAWSARTRPPELTGRWLVTAHVRGRGHFHGEMDIEADGGGDGFLTRVRLTSVNDGSIVVRTGRSVVYAGNAWRGRSQGPTAPTGAPDDLASQARETMWIAPDAASAQGRWFWGQYDELGFDVTMQRARAGPTLLLVEPRSLKQGSSASRLRFIGSGFPAQVTPADLNGGPGLTVRRVVSSTPREIVAEVDVAASAAPGNRNVSVRSSTLASALAIYDRVDYVKVTPESSMATFGDKDYSRGVQQFEAIGYQRGPDGKPQTADDLELGPLKAEWSMEIFYETDTSKQARVGTISATGFFMPAEANPGTNFDVWIVATAANESGRDGKPLIGKGYLVVTVPTYTFEGRTYVRELGRWVETGGSAR
jgi:quinohemoprotein amine dehydrogenase